MSNPPAACALAKNKWETYRRLHEMRLPQPPTIVLEPGEAPRIPFDYPLVVKTLYGTKGVGVHLARDEEQLDRVRRHYAERGYCVLVQPFIAPLRELRLLVAFNAVCAVAEKVPPASDFRANWHRGGELCGLDDVDVDTAHLATAATTALGLDYAGVDILEREEGPCVLEVNDAPGTEGLDAACDTDLAQTILMALITDEW